MLKKLVEVTEACKQEANSRPSAPDRYPVQFARTGQRVKPSRQKDTARLLSSGYKWTMRFDLGKQLQFPREIVETLLRPDLVMWSEACKAVLLVELTVPWEGGLEAG